MRFLAVPSIGTNEQKCTESLIGMKNEKAGRVTDERLVESQSVPLESAHGGTPGDVFADDPERSFSGPP